MDLVIGGTGFLGREITCQLLERGKKVRTLCRRNADIPKGAELIIGDITDRSSLQKACRGIETVFHTAALPSITVHWQPFYETNVLGAENVLNACQETGVQKLIYTSSASVVFNGRSQPGVDETAPYPSKFLAHYPHSKAIAEKMILDAGLSPANPLLTCSIRPHVIIGERDRHLIPRLLDRAKKGKLFRVGSGRNMIDITFVENAALGHIQAAEALTGKGSPVNGNAYFLSQGEPVNCWEWIDNVLVMKGLPKVRRSLSLPAAWTLGTALEVWYKIWRLRGEPVMTRFLAATLAETHYLNIAKARQDFGYAPVLSMEEGMKRLAAAMRKI
ncbi:MAG: NAD-dependent epimerase/dehydratase family protein [Planctomycetaceae bacterium]|jgi:nucleoside-diphosphate-sugar epimerase|nr:NAD-dependent epimerase/dehydratase family protein [Planctomycetaceae bacterium]